MPDFNPDDYLSNKASEQEAAFNPDNYITAKDESASALDSAAEGAGQGLTLGYANNLRAATEPLTFALMNKLTGQDIEPDNYLEARDKYAKHSEKLKSDNPKSYTTGMIGGGVLSTALMPSSTVAKGATAGARILNAAKTGAAIGGISNPGDQEGELAPFQLKDRGLNAAGGFALGGALQGLGEGVFKGATLAKQGGSKLAEFLKSNPKANAEEIKAAAKALGAEATPGMLDGGGFVERAEQSLSESPSYWGRKTNNDLKRIYESTRKGTDSLLKDASPLSPFQLGEKVKSGISENVNQRVEPISKVFDDVAASTEHIPLGEKSVKAIQRNIGNLDEVRLLGPHGKIKHYSEALGRLENANDVKKLRTMVQADIETATGAEKQALYAIKEKLGTLEKNSITRAAIQSAKEGLNKSEANNEFMQLAAQDEGREVAKQLVGDLKGARNNYRGLMGDLGEVAGNARLGKPAGPQSFLNSLDNVPSERIGDKLLKLDDNRAMQSLAEKFPNEFKLLKGGKLKELAEASQLKGNTSANRFLKEVEKLNPEAKAVLFGEEAGKIGQIETVTNNMPKDFNPSGTASQSMWNKDALMSNFTDIPRYAAYKMAGNGSAQKIAERVANMSPRFAEMAQKNPKAFMQLVERLALSPKFQEKQKAQEFNPDSIPMPMTEDKKPLSPMAEEMLKKPVWRDLQKKNPHAFDAAVEALSRIKNKKQRKSSIDQ